jgi:hypothetical protein
MIFFPGFTAGTEMTMTSWLKITAALLVGLVISTSAGAEELSSKEVEFFEKKIRPLLSKHCYKCHSAQSDKSKGGLVLDSVEGWMAGGDTGPAIVAGNVKKSLLLRAVSYTNPDLEMPPKRKLADHEIKALVEWVRRGAPDPRVGAAKIPAPKSSIDIEKGRQFWAFQAPKESAPPTVKSDIWVIDNLDRFVLAKLEEKNLTPVGDASRATYIRRVNFDLIGLPPTPAEVEAFVKNKSPMAHHELVDRLLGSKRFGERWGRHWLDIARFAESTGKTRNYPYSHAWRYRDYVIDSFNADKPYNRFVTEQVAGDLLPAKNTAQRDRQRIATAFLALGPKDLNERDKNQYLMDNVDEQIDVTTRAILGLTVSCARCHDHKFDPIPTKDYYAIAGIFRSTDQLVGMGSKRGGGNRYNPAQLYPIGNAGKVAAATEPPPSRGNQRALKRIQTELAAAKQELKTLQQGARKTAANAKRGNANKRKGKNRKRRKVSFPGDVLAAPANDAKTLTPTERNAKIRELRQTVKELSQKLSRTKKKNQKRGGGAKPSAPAVMGVRDGARQIDCRICVRGDVSNLGAQVDRGFLQVISVPDAPQIPSDSSGRLELASWLTSEKNPLTARVMANRIWYHLFGRGIVRTVDNFGLTGDRPTHPELLDHLALRFVRGGWSVKKLVRSIVLSRTYRLDSTYDEKSYAIDPGNELLWRVNQRRLDVEALRDAMMSVSGELDLETPKGSIVTNFPVGEIGRNPRASGDASASNHRSVYLPVLRSSLPTMFETFDFADPSMVKGQRDVTTVSTQALFLLNSDFVRTQSLLTARRVLSKDGLDDRGRVSFAYQLAFSRTPTKTETERALGYLEATSESSRRNESLAATWASFCQALLASAEFRYLN